jgi:hypothetical protein
MPDVLRDLAGDAPDLVIGSRWHHRSAKPLRALLADEVVRRPNRGHAVVDLDPFHGRSLVQASLAAACERVTVIVPNETEGLRDADEQQRLRAVLRPLYGDVALLRSYRGSKSTVVELTQTPADPDDLVARSVWRRPMGRVRKTLLGALEDAARARSVALDKNEALEAIESTSLRGSLELRLVDLANPLLAELLAEIRRLERETLGDGAVVSRRA